MGAAVTFRLSECCKICGSTRWCGRPCVHAPKELRDTFEAERERQIEHMVDPPRVANDSQPPLIPKAVIDEFEAGPAEKVGVPAKRGRPPKRTPEERKAYRAELMRKKRAEGKA